MADKDTKKNWFARHKVLTVILAVVAIGVVASAAGGGKSNTNNSSSSSSNSSKAESKSQTIKVGEAARDGKFEFVVKSIQCGQASVGSNQYNTLLTIPLPCTPHRTAAVGTATSTQAIAWKEQSSSMYRRT